MERQSLSDHVLRFILSESAEAPSDSETFNNLALRLYQCQFEQNPPYRQFCLLRNTLPDRITRWQDIPPLPVTAFRLVDVACRPISEAARVFYSSGTTQKKKGRHALFHLEIANAAILSHFKRHLLPEQKMRLCILTPSPEEAPDSSLSYMMEIVREAFGTDESDYYIHRGRLLGEKLSYDLSEAKNPVVLLGSSFSFVHFIDFHMERAFPISLPRGSRVMDTGGFKGKSRTVSPHWLYAMIGKRLGIPPEYCVNEYGMSELTSQFYDSVAGEPAPRFYHAPPQMKWQILSPESLQPAQTGEVGLLALYDLANIDSALALLTEDLAKEVEGGFLLIGRAAGADLKGCSLSLDMLLQQTP